MLLKLSAAAVSRVAVARDAEHPAWPSRPDRSAIIALRQPHFHLWLGSVPPSPGVKRRAISITVVVDHFQSCRRYQHHQVECSNRLYHCHCSRLDIVVASITISVLK